MPQQPLHVRWIVWSEENTPATRTGRCRAAQQCNVRLVHCRAVESSAFDAFDALQPDIGDNLHELLCYRTNKAMNTLRVRTPRSTP